VEKINITKLIEEINEDSRWTESGGVSITGHNVGRESNKFLKDLGKLASKASENEWNSIAEILAILMLSIMKEDQKQLYNYVKIYLINLQSRERIDKEIRDMFKKKPNEDETK
jgi:hypothetical protein